MLRTGIRAKKKQITWDRQILGSGLSGHGGKHDETPPVVGGVLTQGHTMEGTFTKPQVLRQKRHFGDGAERAS